METIKSLISQNFALFNVNLEKAPVNRYGNKMGKWELKTFEELQKEHNPRSLLWGLRMGLHENGRYIMSLDFDCCGDKNPETGDRMGCEYTKNKFNEYTAIVDKNDGLYNSSTEGNSNVLIDYTNAPKIIDLVGKIGSKFNLHGLELLLGNRHQQVIPPSKTNCKINKKCFIERTFKNNEPFYILTEQSTIYPFVLDLFNVHFANNNDTKKTNTKLQNTIIKENKVVEIVAIENNDEVSDDMYLELLNNVIRNDLVNGKKKIDWDDKFHIAGILKTNNYKEEEFIKYASKAGTTEKSSSLLWKSISSSKKLSIYGLQSLAKRINHNGYKNWLIKYNKYISLSILDKGENDVAKHISTQLISDLVFCNNKWFVFDKKAKLWRIVAQPYATIISHIQDKIDESKEIMLILKQKEDEETEKKKYVEFEKKYTEFYKQVGKGAFSSQIGKLLQDYLFDGEFEGKLDTTPYKIAYKNGIIDLITLQFREGLKSSDYLTRTIPYNYEKSNKEDIAEIRKELLKICNMKEDHLEYYLSFLGYSLTGDASKIQEFYCLRGQTASNGKSVVFDALLNIIPNYIVKMESDIFEVNYGSRHKEISTWKGIRIAWINELSKKKQDENALKEIADGTAVRYKVMYGGMDTMPITFKISIVSNNTLNINADNGIKRRMKMVQLDSEFVDGLEDDDYVNCRFKKDTSFGTLLHTKYKFALMDLLFSYSKKFVDDGYKLKAYPSDWKTETEEVVKDNNRLQEFIEDRFEFVENAKTSRKNVDEQLALFETKLDTKMFKDTLKSMRKKVTYDSHEFIAGMKGRGYWTGIRLTMNVIDVEEE